MLLDNIISERLILRDMVQDDAKDVWKIWGNSENEKYMSGGLAIQSNKNVGVKVMQQKL